MDLVSYQLNERVGTFLFLLQLLLPTTLQFEPICPKPWSHHDKTSCDRVLEFVFACVSAHTSMMLRIWLRDIAFESVGRSVTPSR
jgi:hypothetical protein